MTILADLLARDKAPPHDPSLCGSEPDLTCPSCRATCWPSDHFFDHEENERRKQQDEDDRLIGRFIDIAADDLGVRPRDLREALDRRIQRCIDDAIVDAIPMIIDVARGKTP